MRVNPLVGTWKLIAVEIQLEKGQNDYPWGQNPIGYLMYTENGYMSVNMMSANRPILTSEDLMTVSKEQLLALADTLVAYSGPYEIVTGKVVHHVEVSILPNQVGMSLERTFKITSDQLVLTTPPAKDNNGQIFSYQISWERLPG